MQHLESPLFILVYNLDRFYATTESELSHTQALGYLLAEILIKSEIPPARVIIVGKF